MELLSLKLLQSWSYETKCQKIIQCNANLHAKHKICRIMDTFRDWWYEAREREKNCTKKSSKNLGDLFISSNSTLTHKSWIANLH